MAERNSFSTSGQREGLAATAASYISKRGRQPRPRATRGLVLRATMGRNRDGVRGPAARRPGASFPPFVETGPGGGHLAPRDSFPGEQNAVDSRQGLIQATVASMANGSIDLGRQLLKRILVPSHQVRRGN